MRGGRDRVVSGARERRRGGSDIAVMGAERARSTIGPSARSGLRRERQGGLRAASPALAALANTAPGPSGQKVKLAALAIVRVHAQRRGGLREWQAGAAPDSEAMARSLRMSRTLLYAPDGPGLRAARVSPVSIAMLALEPCAGPLNARAALFLAPSLGSARRLRARAMTNTSRRRFVLVAVQSMKTRINAHWGHTRKGGDVEGGAALRVGGGGPPPARPASAHTHATQKPTHCHRCLMAS